MLFKERCMELGDRGQRLIREYSRANNSISLDKLKYGSSKKVSWVCDTCGHTWITTPALRIIYGGECPKCGKRKAVEQRIKNSIERRGSLYDWALRNGEQGKRLLDEFDTEENEKEGLRMNELTIVSTKRVHWVCSKGHKWSTQVLSRTSKRPSGCPYCYQLSLKKNKQQA